jgi:hypothetical protein
VSAVVHEGRWASPLLYFLLYGAYAYCHGTAGVIWRHWKQIGSCWRKLNPGRQALLIPAYLRKGETFAELAVGLGVGTATAWRNVTETVALLAARTPRLRRALRDAKLEGTLMSDGDVLVAGRANNETSPTDLYMNSSSADNDAVYVQSNSGNCIHTYTDSGYGVIGSGEGRGGVYGGSKANVGVQGYSNDNIGVIGEGGNIGIFARNFNSGFNAYLGTPGLAGDFYGNVYIHGHLTAEGGKSAAVPHPDGSKRQLYSIESPEMWFEDFGKGELVNGSADVILDSDFAALVDGADCYIFLTEYGDSEGLFVNDQSPTGFSVRERRGGTSSIPFRYRVLAKRKDISRPRLERVTAPEPIPVPSSPEPRGPKR